MADCAEWIAPAFDVSAVFGALLVVYVMQKTEHDRINSVAPPWLRMIRRLSFTIMALLLIYSVLQDASRLSLVLLVWSGIGSLLINAVALHLRLPPSSGSKVTVSRVHGWPALNHLFTSFRKQHGPQ